MRKHLISLFIGFIVVMIGIGVSAYEIANFNFQATDTLSNVSYFEEMTFSMNELPTLEVEEDIHVYHVYRKDMKKDEVRMYYPSFMELERDHYEMKFELNTFHFLDLLETSDSLIKALKDKELFYTKDYEMPCIIIESAYESNPVRIEYD